MSLHFTAKPAFSKPLRLAVGAVFLVAICCGLGIWRWANVQEQRRKEHDAQIRAQFPFRFPYAELAALDSDVQRRFAVVPDKDFGMGRIGKLHRWYEPVTGTEKKTITALQKRQLQVTFYVMSRRTWRDFRRGLASMPLQGPLYLTPPPAGFVGRRVRGGFFSKVNGVETFDPPEFADPNGKEVNPPAAPTDLPPDGWLYGLGMNVFEETEDVSSRISTQVSLGESHQMANWRVTAVPVRAAHEACVNCHNRIERQQEQIVLGDAVGMAFYVTKDLKPARATKLGK